MEISSRSAFTVAIAYCHLHTGEAVLPLAVIVVIEFVARASGSFQIRVDEPILIARFARGHWSVTATIVARAALPAFLAAEIGQHVIVRPAAQTVRGPAGVIAAIAPHISHGVNGRGPADDLAACAFDAAARHCLQRLAVIAPVVNAVEQYLAPAERHLDERMAVPAARFEQQHPHIRVGGEPIGKCAAGRTCADDNVIETAGPLRRHAAFRALGLAPVATAKAGRDLTTAIQRVRSAKAGRSIGKSRQRATIGPSAISASVNRSSANQDFAARCPSKILSCATRSALCAGKSAPRSARGFLASLKTATLAC